MGLNAIGSKAPEPMVLWLLIFYYGIKKPKGMYGGSLEVEP